MNRVVKRSVHGTLVKLLLHKQTNRGMRLLEFETRCVRQGEIHELVTTTQCDARAGDRIDHVGFLGFVEIGNGGVIEKGDVVLAAEKPIGVVLGFNDCHFPNHYNILIAVGELLTAETAQLEVEQRLRFCPAESCSE